MARNTPVTDANFELAREAIREQRKQIREYLATEGVDVTGWDDMTVSESGSEPAETN